MYKIFILATSVAFLPLSKNRNLPAYKESYTSFSLPLKNSFSSLLQPQSKSTAQPYSQNWLASAKENIRKSEYHFKWEEKLNAYCTPNRKNNLRFFYNDMGFTAEPRTTEIPQGDPTQLQIPGNMKYKHIPHWKINFNLNKQQVGNGKWKIVNNTAEYITDKITVQYLNNDEGMRQNFIVHHPLSKEGELEINFSINTKLKTYLHNNQLQFFHKKTNVLNYEQLQVWDATGRWLKAFIKKNKNNDFSIVVDAKRAVYPITVDPLSTTPNSIPDDANQSGAGFGNSVASAGDVNGDGYSDVIIGAWVFDDGANADEGRAFVYHGSATGLPATPNNTPDDADQATALFGTSVSTAGDVNGDGYSDVIIGAWLYDDGLNNNEGRAFVYHGSASGLLASPSAIPDDANQANAVFGSSVASAGDVNGDGYSDVIIGATQCDDGVVVDEGKAFVYHGSATGIGAAPNSTLDDANQANAYFGRSVACAGDVNGDGFSDVIVGAHLYDDTQPNEGVAFVYHGSAGGLPATPNNTPNDGDQLSAQFGFSVASAGDVNGDGFSDVIIGANLYDDGANSNEGRAYIYHGSLTGLLASPTSTPDDADQDGATFGYSVACAGDVNGDGYSDVIIGAPTYDDGANLLEGRAFVYQGSAAGIPASATSTPGDANQAFAQLGGSVASAGDVNGDGYSDVIIGAETYDDGANADEGRAFVYHGSPAGISASPNNTPDDANQSGARFGVSVASAGDVNADGFADVIIGAYMFDDLANTNEGRAFVYHGSATGPALAPTSTPDDADQIDAQFGWSVASAGDVNGDGYSDVIIGANAYNDGANTDEGRAFVYHGSPVGIVSTPSNMPDDANQIFAQFGISVACAGDVNGDGYSDVIIGAFAYTDAGNAAEGRAFVYHGSSTGLGATFASAPDDCNQANALFGVCVASAGDVNGDGYSDVIIGAHYFDDAGNNDEGRAFVYHGSATGIAASPNNTPDDANQAAAQFARAVACAGDVNGDGYSDVIIGAFTYDDAGNADEGRAFVYHGSATGLPANPNNTPDDADQAGAQFGYNTATAGDVNGDGYSDVIISAHTYNDGANTGEGRVFIYHGSSTGLGASPASTPDDANQASAEFGSSVASAGDINGDGYSDVIVGALSYDDGPNTDEGWAFIYQGNELINNKRNNLRLYNTDLSTPLNSTNFLFGNFGAGLFAKSFLGRVKGKMVWETRLNYNAYSGTPITNSTFFTDQQAGYSDLGTAGAELKSLITKINGGNYTKLRARVKYDPATSFTGQAYGPWRNVSSIIDANNLGILPIEIISFSAAWVEKGRIARIGFTTDTEIGTCCFDIEKSTDGFNYFSIGSLPAKNSAGLQSYAFTDARALHNTQFYRLKVKGISGQVVYSNIVQLNNQGSAEIIAFPNPATDVIQLRINNSLREITGQVINTAGQVVMQFTSLPVSNQLARIPLQNIPPGKYWLRLQANGEKQTLQFIKQ